MAHAHARAHVAAVAAPVVSTVRPRPRLDQPTPIDGSLRLVGKVLEDRYKLTGFIASGGFGVVLEGRDLTNGDIVAVKVLRAPKEMAPRFWREVASMKRVKHPALPKLLAWGTLKNGNEDPQPYLVMERIDGRTLTRWSKDRMPMAPADAIALLRPIAHALEALHASGIAHRDVKPDNILVPDDGGEARLVDLGIAYSFAECDSRLTFENHLVASPHYIAPEAARGAQPAPSMDCYSLAVCAFELMTGGRPFRGRGVDVLIEKTRTTAPYLTTVAGRTFTVHLELAMAHCLDRDPTVRPKTPSEVLDLIEGALR